MNIDYDQRYTLFLHNLEKVHSMGPKEKWLYPLMNSVCFQDTEVFLDMMIENSKGKIPL